MDTIITDKKLLSNSYWIIPGQFLIGPYPGSLDDRREQMKIRYLSNMGIQLYIDLTTTGEISSNGEPLLLYEKFLPADTVYKHIPIEDRTAPPIYVMDKILNCIDEALFENKPIYLHCRGGKYRTGMVACCFFIRHNIARQKGVLGLLESLRRFQKTEQINMLPNQKEMISRWNVTDTNLK